ncbi:hypothetical protein CR513_16040, partial [Mucuna pruriens]
MLSRVPLLIEEAQIKSKEAEIRNRVSPTLFRLSPYLAKTVSGSSLPRSNRISLCRERVGIPRLSIFCITLVFTLRHNRAHCVLKRIRPREEVETDSNNLEEVETNSNNLEEVETESNNLEEAETDSNNLEKAEINFNNLEEAKTDSRSQLEAGSDLDKLKYKVSQLILTSANKFSPPHSPSTKLKPLLDHLKYVYLDDHQHFPIIIANNLHQEQEEKLLNVLRKHKKAIGWTLAYLPGINPSICMHKILLEEEARPIRQHWR